MGAVSYTRTFVTSIVFENDIISRYCKTIMITSSKFHLIGCSLLSSVLFISITNNHNAYMFWLKCLRVYINQFQNQKKNQCLAWGVSWIFLLPGCSNEQLGDF